MAVLVLLSIKAGCAEAIGQGIGFPCRGFVCLVLVGGGGSSELRFAIKASSLCCAKDVLPLPLCHQQPGHVVLLLSVCRFLFSVDVPLR